MIEEFKERNVHRSPALVSCRLTVQGLAAGRTRKAFWPSRTIRVARSTRASAVQNKYNGNGLANVSAVKLAAEKAFGMAGLTPQDMSLAELHDAFTILEIAESEEVGFFEKGAGHIALENGETAIDGRLPINPSGGLKGKGHPVGATGVAQAHEIVTQLRHEAGERQAKDAEVGLTLNFGGFGNNVICMLWKREA